MQAYEYHNLGNDYYKKEDFDKAIECYLKALELYPNLLETYFNLGLAYTRKSKYDEAVRNLDKVIQIDPALAEAYYTRGLIREYQRKYDEAVLDYEKTLLLDPQYEKARKQRDRVFINAIRAIFEDYSLLDWIDSVELGIIDGRLKDAVSSVKSGLVRIRDTIERPSCNINCNSLCCHFEDEMWNYGVMIEPEKLPFLKKFLSDRRLVFSDYVGFKRWDSLSVDEKNKEIKPQKFVVNEEGVEFIYYPKTDSTVAMTEETVSTAPLSLNYDCVEWITLKSHPCVFVSGGCNIHDIGVEGSRGLDVCRNWICLTGYVINLFWLMGVLSKDETSPLKMNDLNKIAGEGVRLLYEQLYCDKALASLIDSRNKKLKSVVEQHINGGDIEAELREYYTLSCRLEAKSKETLNNIRIKTRNLLQSLKAP